MSSFELLAEMFAEVRQENLLLIRHNNRYCIERMLLMTQQRIAADCFRKIGYTHMADMLEETVNRLEAHDVADKATSPAQTDSAPENRPARPKASSEIPAPAGVLETHGEGAS